MSDGAARTSGAAARDRTSGLVVSGDELERIRRALDRHPWYRAALAAFEARVDELIARAPEIPVAKGRAFYESCVVDGTRLAFDPYAPHRHVCPTCGRDHTGEAFDLAWVRQFQEWLGKRLVEAGILYALELHVPDARERYARVVRDALAHFVRHYREYPLAHNLLGPTRLFQSTYLEAFWLVDMVAAYDLTRAARVYSEADHSGVRDLFYESCQIVRSFDEGVSNRQAFNNAGMGAVALLYEDAELLDHVLAGPHGFRFHMRESLLEDGIWYEGETYHFATLDHTLNLAEMARHRGIDLYHGASGYGALRPMFDGPLKVMLPDLTFPSRKDSWFGRGIEYHRDVYELGFARYGDERYGGLLAHAYASGGDRSALGWRTFLHLEPELPSVSGRAGPGATRAAVGSTPDMPLGAKSAPPVADDPGTPSLAELRPTACEPMPGTGVAVLRRDTGAVYAGVEYGHYGGGHGHPDRLHLTLFADGVHWLADPGTGWYHVPELSWYRSTLAHATVTVDGRPQNPREGRLVAFGDAGGFQASQARVEDVANGVDMRRTLLMAEGFLLDVFDVTGEPGSEHTFDWAFHTRADLAFAARPERAAPEGPEAGLEAEPGLGDRDGYEFLSSVAPLPPGDLDATLSYGGKELRILQLGAGPRFRASSPGIPLQGDARLGSVVSRRQGGRARFVTLWAWGEGRHRAALTDDGPGLVRVEIGDRAYRARIDDAAGIAVVRAHRDEVEALAWFGRRTARFGPSAPDAPGGRVDVPGAGALGADPAVADVALEADHALAAAALVRDGGGWRAVLPERFGRVAVTGLPATTLAGLPQGAELRTERGVEIRQPAGRTLRRVTGAGRERTEEDAQELFAGCENDVLLDVASYGREDAEPTVEVPSGWRPAAVTRVPPAARDAPPDLGSVPTRWRVRVAVPGMPASAEGELVVRVAERRWAVPYRVVAPLAAAWSVSSEAASPRAVLEVRDVRGTGGAVGLEVQCPWLPSDALPREIDLAPHGRAHVALPLPLRPPGLAHVGGAGEPAPGDARGGVWELPGRTGFATGFLVTARLSLEGFTGITRARLPLVWALPAGTTSHAAAHRLRLDREAQASWADRRWRGGADASAGAQLHWSPDGLHLACEVIDDAIVTDANGDDLYENDSVQVYFDFRPEHRRDRDFSRGVAAYVLAPGENGDEVRVAPIAGNREISNRGARAAWFTAEGVAARSRRTAGGYRIDAFFPFASLGVDPVQPGAVVGFDLSLSDNDGTWYRNTQLLWSGSRGRRCYIRGSYHDPREYGWLVIGEAP